MEDSGIVKKSKIIFTVFLIIGVICLVVYMIFGKSNSFIDETKKENPNLPTETINKNGVYGLFVNLQDAESYFKYQEDETFEFVLNVCEGYVKYNNENAKISTDVSTINDKYNIKIKITPKSNKDNNVIILKGSIVSSIGIVDTYDGPNSCSPTSQYKKA